MSSEGSTPTRGMFWKTHKNVFLRETVRQYMMEMSSMRKVLCMLTVLLLCMSMVLPVFATQDGFVPSITYKPNPELVSVVGEDGKEYIGVIRDAEGKIIDYVGHGCLLITPVAHIWDEEIEVPQDVEDLLRFVYEGLNDGSITVPYEKHEADLDAANMVIRDLFDARWACKEHPKMLEPEGVVLELTFDLGVIADAQIFCQTYDEAAKDWFPIVSVVNNGDGTVTCVFEHLCAIEFSMPLTSVVVPTEETAKPNATPWIVLLIAAAGATVGVVVAKSKKKTAV